MSTELQPPSQALHAQCRNEICTALFTEHPVIFATISHFPATVGISDGPQMQRNICQARTRLGRSREAGHALLLLVLLLPLLPRPPPPALDTAQATGRLLHHSCSLRRR